jgi:uncharacterized protein (DUF1501 family)
MKRRDFLKLSPAISLPFLINGMPLTAAANNNPLLHLLREQSFNNGRVLVLVQLNGGNDGINTLIPLDQYSQLLNARSNIVIPERRVLPLNGLEATAMHPAMSGMQQLYNNGQMNIVQAVSYPNPNYSHFRSTDIWFSGSSSDNYLNTGWIGRTLDTVYPGYPEAYINNPDMPDPLAVQIGSQATIVTQCNTGNTAMTVTNPNYFFNLINGVTSPTPDSPYGHELKFLRLIKQQTNAYTAVIRNAYNKATNLVAYPGNNSLADQLKIVACLIKGGLKTPVYIVNHQGSFDTHANQVVISDTTTGKHAELLDSLSTAITSFQQDMVAMGLADRVAAMTFTEFGRRIKSNDSLGTDHGTSTPVFFFSNSINPIIIGTNPTIPSVITANDQVPMQHDFRAVYYTVLKDWFLLTDTQLSKVLPDAYTTLPIFKQIVALPVSLLSFTGKWTNRVTLQWEVDQESGIDGYDIQRSEDGVNFEKIGTTSAINTSIRHTYTFTDAALTKTAYYYRIKILEQSAAVKFSPVILLKTNQATGITGIKVAPNPVTDSFNILFENKLSGLLTITITDLNGKEILKQQKEVHDVYTQPVSLKDKKPASGIYIVKVYTKSTETSTKIVIR